MKPSYLYLALLLLSLGIIAVLGFTFSGPVIYSLETDLFPSLFHENTDALKVKSFNSTIDILPLMQDLLDYSGPIVLNINIRDMNQVKYYLDLFSKNNIKLKNLVVNLDMTESEMEEFSSDKLLQQKLLQELMDSTIAMDELDSLMVTYRDDNGMLISLKLQREAIMKRIRELSAEYEQTSEKIQKIAEKIGLDTTAEKESVQEVKRIVEKMEEKTPVIKTPLPQIPTLSLLVKPESGKYGDSIGFSGLYSSGITAQERTIVTINIDSKEVARANTDSDGIYTTLFEIEHIAPGEHAVVATSGIVSSGTRTFSVIPVNSTTSLYVLAVYNKPEIQGMGEVRAGKQVRNAPVEIITDYRNILPLITDKNGVYRTQIRLSPGTHHIQARFVNDTYPIFLSKSPAYEVIAGPDSILSIRLLDADMGADELSLTLDPATVMYRDVINITGFLGGKEVKNKKVDLFIDGVFSRSLQTGTDGSYAGTYAVEKTRAGNHTFFTHYGEPEIGELYSASRQIVVKTSDTITTLETGMTDGGTGVICAGNVTARGKGVSSAPVELVWDDRNSVTIQTDATGAFRQKLSLPTGNHSIVARFSSPDYPLLPSRSITHTVTVLPPVDLSVTPRIGQYLDTLTMEGSLHGTNSSFKDISLFIDGKRTFRLTSDAQGLFVTPYTVENIAAGEHTVQALSGDHSSELQRFLITPVASDLVMSAERIPDSYQVTCSGILMENNRSVRNAPILIIADDRTVSEIRTDSSGRFEDTITLPAGKHRIRGMFTSTSQFPLNPSQSQTTEIDIPRLIIPGNLTLTVMPADGRFSETVHISGTLSSRTNSGETIQLSIDGRKQADTTTDRQGNYSFLYLIDRLPSGSHAVEAISKNFRSEPGSLNIIPVDAEISLSLEQIPGTPRVSCSGTVQAHNQSLRFAPVTIVVDGKDNIRTETDESGNYREIIPATAGIHKVQAQFNSTDIFPVNPSKSPLVEITISPGLSLNVRPASGIYQDTITFEGTLIRSGNPESTVDLFIDNNLLAAAKTDSTGRYTYPMTIEQVPAGKHTVQARSADISSGVKEFQVLPVHSVTTFTIIPVNNSALYGCSGTVMAFDHAGEITRYPSTIGDAETILAGFWTDPQSRANRPVGFARVEIISNNDTVVQTTTDAEGHFSQRVTLPAGDNRVAARFINDSFPIYSSSSGKLDVNNPSANISFASGARQSSLSITGPLVMVAVLLLFIGGAGIYLKQKTSFFSQKSVSGGISIRSEIPPEQIADLASDGETRQSGDTFVHDLPAQDPIFVRYLRVLETEGLSTAARAVYVHFTGTIAHKNPVRNHRVLTPREFVQSCKEQPFIGTFSSFISLYERIRYGGVKTPETKAEFEESVQETDKSLEGEDH